MQECAPIKDDVDVDAGGQDIMFGCASEETELRHASHTPDGNSFEEAFDRLAQEGWSVVVVPRRQDVAKWDSLSRLLEF